MTRFSLAAFGLCLAVLLGCQTLPSFQSRAPISKPVRLTHPDNYFVSEYYTTLRPRRVVIVAPPSRFSNFRDQEKFAEAFALELRNHGVAEAVVAREPLDCNIHAIRRGQFDEREVIRLSQWYNADAVVFCDVTNLSAYPPMSAAVSAVMVDAWESVILFAADGKWDLSDGKTNRAFTARNCRANQRDKFATDIFQQSPSHFLEFVADELARFMKKL